MQGTLTASDNGAAQTPLRQFEAAQQARQSPTHNHGIKFHGCAPSPDRKALIDPAGKLAFAQGIAPGDGLNAFPALV